MTKNFYRSIVDLLPIGYAFHKIILNEDGQPCDFEIIEANGAFERYIGLSALAGKRLTGLLPDTRDRQKWIDTFGPIALEGTDTEFTQYSKALKKCCKIKAFSPEKYFFVTLVSAEPESDQMLDSYFPVRRIDHVWTMDLDFNITYVSPYCRAILQYNEEDAGRLALDDVLSAKSMRRLKSSVRRERKREDEGDPERTWSLKLELYRKDGGVVWTENTLKFKRDEKLVPVGVVGVPRNITEQELAKHALRKSEEKLRLILDCLAEGIYGVDTRGNCTFCNLKAVKILGYNSAKELLGKNMHDMIHYKSADGTAIPREACKVTATYLYGEETHADDEVFWRADGTSFSTEYFAYPQFDHGRVSGAVVTFYDISRRKNTEKKLYESERSKAVLLSNIPGMAYRCRFDRDWTMLLVSEGCFGLTGYRPESLLHNKELSYNAIISPGYRDYLWEKWSACVENKTKLKEEYTIITRSGEVKWVLEQAQAVYDANGAVAALEGLIVDITDRKIAEEKLLYLSYHDYLTGLYNRRYFDLRKAQLDRPDQLPLSVIIGDINGVKLINDAFGHSEGDKMIVETAAIIQACCRKQDELFRTGGDEFSILLPGTDSRATLEILRKIQNACRAHNFHIPNESFHINISLGYGTKETMRDSMERVTKTAEKYMFQRKLLEHKSSHSAIISSMKATLLEKSHDTEEHGERLAFLSRIVGKALNLSQNDLDNLELLATLHDIGKVGIDDHILNKNGELSAEEWTEMRKHPEIGYRIAVAAPDLMPIADYILSHHERWDGNGYPQNLAGEDIPLLSRILALVDAYDAMTQDRPYRKAMTFDETVDEIKNNVGTQFDPVLAEIFIGEILGKRKQFEFK